MLFIIRQAESSKTTSLLDQLYLCDTTFWSLQNPRIGFPTTCLLSAKCPCPVTTPDGRPNMVYKVGHGKVWRASNTLYIPCAKLNIQTLLWDSPYSTFNNLDPITAQFSLLLGIWAWHHLPQAGWSKCEGEGNDLPVFHLPRDFRLFLLPWEWGYFICCENGAISSAMRMSAISSAMRMWAVQGINQI